MGSYEPHQIIIQYSGITAAKNALELLYTFNSEAETTSHELL